jgi:sugar/nucleoside kinase (ribokinase family)
LICPWGDVGAAAFSQGTTIEVPALTGIKVIDTLGAGDTFIAGIIGYLWKHGWTCAGSSTDITVVRSALEFGCLIAGHKCTMRGYQGLKQYISHIS